MVDRRCVLLLEDEEDAARHLLEDDEARLWFRSTQLECPKVLPPTKPKDARRTYSLCLALSGTVSPISETSEDQGSVGGGSNDSLGSPYFSAFRPSMYSWPSESRGFQLSTVAVYRHCDSVVTDETFSRTLLESDYRWLVRQMHQQMMSGLEQHYNWVLGGNTLVAKRVAVQELLYQRHTSQTHLRHLPPRMRSAHTIRAPPPAFSEWATAGSTLPLVTPSSLRRQRSL
jgi:hypothetical protein